MKNFYEATVTRPVLTIPIKLTLDPLGVLPCMVKINGSVIYENTISSSQIILKESALTDDINISIQIYRNHPDALKISLIIDDHDILPLYQHLANPPTCYLDSNNIWTFGIPSFYPWIHEITGQGWIA